MATEKQIKKLERPMDLAQRLAREGDYSAAETISHLYTLAKALDDMCAAFRLGRCASGSTLDKIAVRRSLIMEAGGLENKQ